MARVSPANLDSKYSRGIVEQFRVGKLVEDDITGGVWILKKNVLSGANKINSYKGTFLRRGAGTVQKLVLSAVAPGGNSGFMRFVDLEKVEGVEGGLSAKTDEDLDLDSGGAGEAPGDGQEGDGARGDAPNEGAGQDDNAKSGPAEGKDATDKTAKEKHLAQKFYRCIPATHGEGGWLNIDDPISKNYDVNFRIPFGEIVLDTGIREAEEQTDTARVIRTDGLEGKTWFRRLQLIEKPFGLMDNLPLMLPFELIGPEVSDNEVRKRYREIHGTLNGRKPKRDRVVQLNEEEPLKRVGLRAWKFKYNYETTVGRKMQFEKGEFVLQQGEPTKVANQKAGRFKGKADTIQYTVRDFEGAKGVVDGNEMEKVSDFAWGLCLDKQKLEQMGGDGPFEKGIVGNEESEERVEENVEESVKPRGKGGKRKRKVDDDEAGTAPPASKTRVTRATRQAKQPG